VNFSKERGVKLFKEFFDLGSESADKQSANNLFGKISGEASEINRFDGVRITFKNGEIIHLRPSGNAPELRIYTEAGTVERAAEINKKAMERVRKILENSK
jgi:phosphomannomutase